MKVKIIITIVVLMIFGCRSKKEYIETNTTDTIKVSKIVKITPKQLNSLVIDTPCDSLGNLKPFTYTFGSGKNKTVLKAKNDTIYLEQNNDSIINSWKEEYKSSFKSEDARVEIPVTPGWAWKLLIYSILATIWIFKKPLLKLIKPI